MRGPDNPFFARAFVNRVWGHYFGVGIVNPVDNFSLANPPSNPKLLDALAKDFVESKFDIRRLERTVLNSRAYQLSSTANATNRQDRINYSHSFLRPMMAEVVLDVLDDAVGVKEKYGPEAPPDVRAIEIGASRVNGPAGVAFRVFGRPTRAATCDCERASEPALSQKLYLMADDTLAAKVNAAEQPPQGVAGRPQGRQRGAGRAVPGHGDAPADRPRTGEIRPLPRGTQGPPGRLRRRPVGAGEHE